MHNYSLKCEIVVYMQIRLLICQLIAMRVLYNQVLKINLNVFKFNLFTIILFMDYYKRKEWKCCIFSVVLDFSIWG
jgi:hypothetical protein